MHKHPDVRKAFLLSIIITLPLFLLLINPASADPANSFVDREEIIGASNTKDTFALTDNTLDSWAIIIGISDYRDVSDLVYTDNDAIDLCNKLKEFWPEDHIRLFVNQNASKSNIETAITDWLAPRETAESVVLIFFSGHGCNGYDVSPYDEDDGKDEYLCPYDSLTYSYDNDIRDDTLNDWLNTLDSQHLSVYIDSCYSGGFIDKATKKDLTPSATQTDTFAKDLSKTGRVIITASAETESSWEYTSIKHGVFTYYLLKGLDNLELMDADGNSGISAEETFYYLAPLVRAYTDLEQNPQIYDGHTGDLMLINALMMTFDANISEASITIDDATYDLPVSVVWALHTEHTFSVSSQVEPDDGTRHSFSSWSDGSTLTSRTVTVTESALTSYTANYQTQYYLTIDSDYGSPTGEGWYDIGSTASFNVESSISINEKTRLAFSGWSGDSSAATSSATVVMDEPKLVYADWQTQYYLTIVSDYGGVDGEGWYNAESTVSFEAASTVGISEATQGRFMGWSGDSSAATSSATVVMDYPKQVFAEWQIQYYLDVNSDYGNPDGDGWYDAGTTAYFDVEYSVSVADDERVVFVSWTGDSSASSSSASLVMDSPKQVDAEWQTQFYLSVSVDPVGAVSLSCDGWYDEGSEALTETAPLTCSDGERTQYIFESWKIDDAEQDDNPVSVMMDSPHSLVACYRTQYYLTVVSPYGAVEGAGWYDADSEASFSVQSPQGFLVQDVFTQWGGDSTGTAHSSTVLMNSPKTVAANWTKDSTQLYIVIVVIVGVLAAVAIVAVRKLKTR